ncbi:MAG: D-alanine--D-alanine ligase [Pyrinomonadaceae bacterium MAG19_C2-C3]|nr:D-alanine--D-alanine ligase [Pyrinomonadaceae bacterium MAG19_C2-C3]
MAKKLKVGVVFGGRSGEHEVSLRSAGAIIEAMDKTKYEVVPIGITKQGRWLAATSPAQLADVNTKNLNATEVSTGDASTSRALIESSHKASLMSLGGDSGTDAHIDSHIEGFDVVFPVLHGTFGEDGTIQGLLETYNVPYVGCGVLASACGMDKIVMKQLFHGAGLPQCHYEWFRRGEWEADRERITRLIKKNLGFPCFVKPANLGSSVGISKADDKNQLETAIDLAARFDRRIIVEEGLDVREIECAVLGNDEPEASLPGEYIVHDEAAKFLDYAEKYSNTGHNEFVTPAPLSSELQTQVQTMARTAFRAVDGAGLARVDFFLRRDTNELLINELNTMPGFTDTSGYPKMWAASGLSFPNLVDRLITLALERHADKSRNQTSI